MMKRKFPRRSTVLISVLVISFFLLTMVEFLEPLNRFIKALYSVIIEFRLDKFTIHINQNYKIYLWTSDLQLEFQIDDYEGIMESGANFTQSLKMLFHGFSDKGFTSWTDRLRSAYLGKGPHVIISVDWERQAESPWYNSAAKNAERVGEAASRLLHHLVESGLLSWDRVHLIGSSLGAHAAGYAGRFTGGQVSRVTGLDPSGPLFHAVGADHRLDPTDGQFVDIIHSAGRWVGNDDIQGHVDFFPNGGKAPQPGCMGKESLDLSCSHFRGWHFFVESVKNSNNMDSNKFWSVKCASYSEFLSGQCCSDPVEMGDSVPVSTRGTYYLATSSHSTYALPINESTKCSLFL